MQGQPVGRIDPLDPSPSLLTSARDRSGDGFGAPAQQPELPDGLSDTERAELLAVAATESWRSGVRWRPVSCQRSFNEPDCPDYAEEDLGREAPGDKITDVHVNPFTIYTPLACEWTTRSQGDGLADDALALTRAHTAHGLARALWLGEGLPADDLDNPTLRRVAVDASIGGAAADLDDAMASLLANYERCTGGNGGAVLHVPSTLMPFALGGGAGGATTARKEGNLYVGPLGSVVSPGPGYPWGASAAGPAGAGPMTDVGPPEAYAGNLATEAWIYVSGPVEYALTAPVAVPEDEAERRDFHRRNKYELWGQRRAIVRFDPCCVFAALVTSPAGNVPDVSGTVGDWLTDELDDQGIT